MPWKWNISAIEALKYADNVVDLMEKKLAVYPEDTREILGIASCIGNIFEMETLEAASGKSLTELLPLLAAPMIDDVITLKDTAAFTHDRLQEAAYRLLDENRITEIHYAIGNYLYRTFYDADSSDKYLFRIVDHLNAAIGIVADVTERKNLIEVNLKAGKRALNSVAYKSALHYISIGIGLLPEDCFESMYDVAFALHLEFAEVTHLNGDTEKAISITDELFKHAIERYDITLVYIKKIIYLSFKGKYPEAVKNGQKCYRLYNSHLTKSYFQFIISYYKIKYFLKHNSEEDILNLPVMKDRDELLFAEFSYSLGLPVYAYSKIMLANAVMSQINFSEVSIYHPFYYHGLALVMVKMKNYSDAYFLGSLSIQLMRKLNSIKTKGSVLFTINIGQFHWNVHLNKIIPSLEEVYLSYFDTGDIIWSPWGALYLIFYKFFTGIFLKDINIECEKYYNFIKQKPDVHFSINMIMQVTKNLKGVTSSYLNWDDENFSEDKVKEDTETVYTVKSVKYIYFVLKEFTSIIFNQYNDGFTLSMSSHKYIEEKQSNLIVYPLHIFMYTISITKQYSNNSNSIKQSHRRLCKRHIKQMHLWAKNCPDNFLQFYLLMQAEYSRITGNMRKDETGRKLSAEELYDRAIETSRLYEYINFEAIANELAGEYYLEKKSLPAGYAYITESCRLFEKWGAEAKCRQLRERYPQLFSPAGNFNQSINNVDVMSILKVSQSISGEIEFDSLLKTITRLVMENAGADKGALILPEHGRLAVKALMRAGHEADIFSGVFIDNKADLPGSLIRYVERTGETYITGNSAAPDFSSDRYLAAKKPGSVLCAPVLNQGKLIGILYLENSLVRDVFTKERVEVLNLLVSQTAISLENAALYADLENRVDKRTKELNNAVAKLHELDQAKSTFFSNISHELRTPLTLIIGPVESALIKGGSNNKELSFLNGVHSNASRLLQLINNLLDFTKIEEGRMNLYRIEEDISKLLNLYVANVRSGAESMGLSISFENCAADTAASIDCSLFENAVYNLISNAIKFTPHGGKIIVRLNGNETEVFIDVIDTGIGIPADKHSDIFERFTQLDVSSTRKYQGTGIGLSLTKQIALLHGGDVLVDSSEGEGSNFTLVIPRREKGDANVSDKTGSVLSNHIGTENSPVAAEYSTPVSPEIWKTLTVQDKSKKNTSEPGNGNDLKLLLVEDNSDMLEFLRDILSSHYNLFTAGTGREAIDYLESAGELPDIIVSDIMMPGMDGIEFLEYVRKQQKYDGIPVIFLSARADIETRLSGFDTGAADYIVKPFNGRELLARIKAHLDMKSLRDRLERANESLYAELKAAQSGAGNSNKLKSPVSEESEEKVLRVVEFIRQNFTSDLSREGMAAAVDLSADYLSRVFNKVTGKRIDEYISELRVEEAKKRLKETDRTVTAIAFDVGFDNIRTFNKAFAASAGMTPTEWRILQRGELL